MKYEFQKDRELPSADQPAFQSLHSEFERFIGKYKIDTHVDKATLKELGMNYMREWEQANEE